MELDILIQRQSLWIATIDCWAISEIGVITDLGKWEIFCEGICDPICVVVLLDNLINDCIFSLVFSWRKSWAADFMWNTRKEEGGSHSPVTAGMSCGNLESTMQIFIGLADRRSSCQVESWQFKAWIIFFCEGVLNSSVFRIVLLWCILEIFVFFELVKIPVIHWINSKKQWLWFCLCK